MKGRKRERTRERNRATTHQRNRQDLAVAKSGTLDQDLFSEGPGTLEDTGHGERC
jgi:hypothetical protein